MTSGVSAVIVSYNVRELVVRCIASLRDDGVDEIVVIDNASVERTTFVVTPQGRIAAVVAASAPSQMSSARCRQCKSSMPLPRADS